MLFIVNMIKHSSKAALYTFTVVYAAIVAILIIIQLLSKTSG